MKIYNSYKDSNIEWIGKIPSHWTILRGKYWTKIISGFAFDSNKFTKEEGYIGLIRIRDIYKTETEMNYKGSYSKDAIVQTGDILIGMDGDFNIERWKGKPALLNQRVCKICNTKKGNENYLFYLLPRLLKCINDVTYSTTVKHLSVYDIINSELPLPPLSEQQAIATYLDKKCGEINHAIDVQKKKIDLLNELKQTIITDAVTKGLNPNAPMKDSGMEWIGQVPQHWEVMRLRFVCEFRNGYTPSKANPDFWVKGTIPWYRMEDIREKGRFLNEANQYITKEAVKGNGLFEAGSFILATTATIGEHAVLIVDSLANQQFTNLKIRKSLIHRVVRDFFFYYLFVIDNYCKSTTRVATFPAVNMNDLKNFCVTLPSIQEQQSIVAHIEKKITKIDSQITKANRRIELLEELKQSIITEAVTGKIKVC